MIAKFFNTSKPIHSVIIAVFLFIVFFVLRIESLAENFNFKILFNELIRYFIILGSVFVLDFLAQKNKLTKKNGYEILIFSLLLVTFPVTLNDASIFVANFFVLLALRRIISLKSNLRIKKKLYDATFWICIAALFHFWSILFLALVISALLLYGIRSLKNWIIPIIGILTVIVLVIAHAIIFDNSFGNPSNFFETIGFNFSSYNNPKIVIPVVILSLLSLWTLGFYVVNLSNKPKSIQPSFVLVLITFLLGLSVILVTPIKNTGELIFVFPAMTLIVSNYFESIKNNWLAEGLVLVLLLLPIVGLVL